MVADADPQAPLANEPLHYGVAAGISGRASALVAFGAASGVAPE